MTRQGPMGAVTRTVSHRTTRSRGVAHPTTMKKQGLLQQVITIATIEYDTVSPSVFEPPSGIRSQLK